MIFRGLPWLYRMQQSLQVMIDIGISAIKPSGEKFNPSVKSDFPLPNFIPAYLIAIVITLAIIITQLLVMLVAIRRNLLQVFRGDDCEIPRRTSSDSIQHASGNVHFAGYFIGYLLWGYILVGIIAFIITLIMGSLIRFGSVRFVERILKSIIPLLLIIAFKSYLNKILAQYVFLQQAGNVLSLENRRLFMVFVYFNFFLDAFLGLVSSIMRIGRGIIGGIVYMCRLDYATMGRKLETMDEGFSAYCGFIHMECAHRHPVMLFFVSHVLRQYLESTKKLSRAHRKWHIAVFLIANPTFVYRRKAFLEQSNMNEKRLMLIGLRNRRKIYVEQPFNKMTQHASVISQIDLNDLSQRQQF
ncbi:unnamed protein product [Rotaria sp. Silwood2]|nr:unnamed protein product [Rotaria sp. Silwood2]CAF2579093.1 unnamed protein product [Rotaria sp. Silwood2]CAF2987292.1 unnamed protein product [Rotaria sp. Silwood2]CAF3906178.1 unnamed protein product [Rotaria sp. Silwood2]CAF4075611.1 unnamed protein product [Rotaria sp. Silwood2]